MNASATRKVLGLCIVITLATFLAAGCHTTAPLTGPLGPDDARSAPTLAGADKNANPKKTLVQPGMELEWALRSVGKEQPNLVRAGRALVAPDGTLAVGPYGSVRLAGLTLEQAGTRVEKQLAKYMKQPRIGLEVLPPPAPALEVVWKKAETPLSASMAFQSGPLAKDTAIRPVDFQPEPPPVQKPFPPAPTPVDKPVGSPNIPMPLPLPDGPNEMKPILLPEYVLRPPDVLLVESQKGLLNQPVRGQHLVRPDGTVGVGIYGSVLVAGKTLSEARVEIARAIHARLDPAGKVKLKDVLDGMSVDVLAYNSSVYYVITDGAGLGEQVYRFPVTGSETVLDAISHINGLPLVSSRRIWVARRNPGQPGPDTMLPVDWKGVTQYGAMNTNWQIMPGDRVYVQADKMRTFNNNFSKFLEPVERLLGVTLLGSQTVNSIRSGTPISNR